MPPNATCVGQSAPSEEAPVAPLKTSIHLNYICTSSTLSTPISGWLLLLPNRYWVSTPPHHFLLNYFSSFTTKHPGRSFSRVVFVVIFFPLPFLFFYPRLSRIQLAQVLVRRKPLTQKVLHNFPFHAPESLSIYLSTSTQST